ncbi:hypothetical protein GCM10009775_17740 [Microbacterium aoyamense]|uniref:Histidine kinase n=1 Tax=Microbacterium aoyamense TaxID=344166 RepID=A0ABN2PP95_9MICO|nr:histidine kinase [Microbacterium aoyamense]
MRTKVVRALAALIVGLEGVALVALTIWQVAAVVAGDTVAIDSALALIVLTAVGAVIVIAFAFALLRGRSWGRSGGIVTQALILAVAIGATTGAYAHPILGVEIAIPAVIALVLLVLDARDAGREASIRSADEPS